jgi:hypothetical protein
MAIPFSSNFDETIPFSDTCWQFKLTTGVEQHITVPGTSLQRYQAIFGFNKTSNLFIGNNTTAAIPASNTNTMLQYVEFDPDNPNRYVKGGDVLSFITPDTATYLSVCLRSVPG